MPRPSVKQRHNLPAHRLHLIGREQDLVVLRHALLETEGRLLTLTGTGGCGKTRLALELASDVLSHFPNGVWLVELAAVADPMLVPQAIASALSVRDRPGESLIATLVGALSKRDVLLVLDNCEHVVEVSAQVVEELLDTCPRLHVLATSREALRIPGEMTWRVPSLAVPDPGAAVEEVARSPAVRLFVERARGAAPDVPVTQDAAVVGAFAGAGDRLYADFGTRRTPAEQLDLEQWVAPLRETLGDQIVDARLAEGAAMELDEAIALAREDAGSVTPAARVSPRGDPSSVLTARELQVAVLLRHGLTNRQIAEQLVITERTVASHIEHILEKLGFASRHQVGAWMVEHGPPG